MTGVTWQMDLVPVWIVQECENSSYDPTPITTDTYTVSGGGAADSSTFDTTSPSNFGTYGSGKHWSLVTDKGEIVEVQSVSGNTVTLKHKLRLPATVVKAREIHVVNNARFAKIYATEITEDFDAEINPEKEPMSPSDIGLPMLEWKAPSIWKYVPSGYIFSGSITINGTVLTQGADFDIETATTFTEAMATIASAINSGIPDVTANQIEDDKIVLSGIVRSVSSDLGWTITTAVTPQDALGYRAAGFPYVYLDTDLKVTRELRIRGYLLTDNRLTALKYRNALWNLTRVGWVRVLQGNYDWKWYLISKVNINKIASAALRHSRSPSNKFIVYNYVKGNAGSDTISVNGTTLTAGTDFNATTSNDVTATNMAAAITIDIAGVTAAASGNEVTLSGTVTELSSGDTDSWTAIAGGEQLVYQSAVDITLTHAPPASEKDVTEAK